MEQKIDFKPQYLMNVWYVAALSSEVGPQALFHRKLLDTSVLIYRKEDGTPVALHDRCPHRFAPLHMGKRIGDEVSCPYHALRFDCEGACTHNPHGNGQIPKAAKVRSFPLLERHGFIWIWMGDAPAEPQRLPDFSPLDEGPQTAIAHTYMHMKAHYELIIDNVMDLSHVDHVHGEIITTRGNISPLIPQIRETGTSIAARWEWRQTPPQLLFAHFLPNPSDEAREYFDITWTPPANIQLSVGATQNGGPLDLENCVGQYDLHSCTPETIDSTHYFFGTRRNHAMDDPEYKKLVIQGLRNAFENEDGPIIRAVHEEMGTADFFSLNPVLMTNDVAPVKVRRLLKRLMAAEREGPSSSI